MNNVLIDKPEHRMSGQDEMTLPVDVKIRFEIGNKSFVVGINSLKDGLVVRENSGNVLSIEPSASNAINIF